MNLLELAVVNAISSGLGAVMLQERVWRNPAMKKAYAGRLKELKGRYGKELNSADKKEVFKTHAKGLAKVYKDGDKKSFPKVNK